MSVTTLLALATTAGMTAASGYLARRLRYAFDTQPTGHVPGAAASCEPDAAREQFRQDRSLPWRLAHEWIAHLILAPFRRRPGFRSLRILVVDHGPGGLVAAVASRAPRDAAIAAMDANAGMGTLARDQASRLVPHGLEQRVGWTRSVASGIPAPTGSFDIVVTAGALHSWPDPESVMRELRRVVAAQGRIVIIDTRRDLPTWAWVTIKVAQRLLMPSALREIDEPSASIRAGYRAQELEWFAARASFPPFGIREGPGWLILEAGVPEGDTFRPKFGRQP
jgi:ubiquinone/menaquinone biosynthesis C-methylase UbiE